MKITRVKGRNFIILKDIDLPVTHPLTRITGLNASGKTSTLTLVEAIMRGMHPSMVTIGEEKAEGSIEIDNGELVIERTQKVTGQGTCKILAPFVMPDGSKKMRPLPVPAQEYLRSLCSDNAFRPLNLLTLKGKERADYFRKIFKTSVNAEMLKGTVDQEDIDKLDFSKDGLQVIEDLTGNKGILYIRRAEINKGLKPKEALLQQKQSELGSFDLSTFKDKSDEIAAISEQVQAKLSDAKLKVRQAEQNKTINDIEQKKIADADAVLAGIKQPIIDNIPDMVSSIVAIKEEINKLQALLIHKEDALKSAKDMELAKDHALTYKKNAEDTIAALAVEVPDIIPIEAELAEVLRMKVLNQDQKDLALKAKDVEALNKEVASIQSSANSLTDAIKKLRSEVTQQIVDSAAIPIKELRIVDDDIFLGEKNIDLLSTREQVNVVIQIVEWMNADKPLKILLLDRAEVLDTESMDILAASIPEGYRFLVTEVYHDGQVIPDDAIFMEKGEVKKKAVAEPPTPKEEA